MDGWMGGRKKEEEDCSLVFYKLDFIHNNTEIQHKVNSSMTDVLPMPCGVYQPR